jgi:uncharacterized membrane protein
VLDDTWNELEQAQRQRKEVGFSMSLREKAELFGVNLADRVSKFVGTWTFVFLYTASMVTWIVLHLTGLLHIDSAEFMKWNLWLSYFAGTQASLVLMSSSRQAHQDRLQQKEAFDLDKVTLEKIHQLTAHIELIENVLEEFVEEQKENEHKDS